MKIIYPNRITSVTASAENANFPDDNLLDEHPKKVWKGTSYTAVVTLVVSAGDAIGIMNTNARTVDIVLKGGTHAEWASGISWASGTSWASFTSDTVVATHDLTPDNVGRTWAEHTYQSTVYTLEITLTASSGDIIEAGVMVAGKAEDFPDPAYGIKEGMVDYSIFNELNNGAFYYRKRDIVRTFDFSLIVNRESYFYTFMHTIFSQLGQDPTMWLLSEKIGTWNWIVYGRLDGLPVGSHKWLNHTELKCKLIEVV